MQIREVSWANFRRLPDAHIEVRNHLVLLGPNDTGKSSVVRALHMCLGMAHGQAQAAITARDFTDEAQPLTITVTLDGIEADDRAAFPDEITAGTHDVLVVRLEATLDPADPEQKTVSRCFPDSGHSRGPTKEQLETIGFHYVPASRSMLRELGGSGGVVRSLLAGLDLVADSAAFQAAADEYRKALDGSAALSGFRTELAGALSEALPVAVGVDEVRIVSDAEALEDPLTGVIVTIREGARDVPLAEQSDGVRALSVMTLLSMSHKTAKIVAVDEPETHLHPTAQRAIARTLRDSGGQRVFVTHSTSIAGEMNPLDIVAFRADRQPRQLPITAPIAALDATVRHWNHNLIEPLTARCVAVVEGVSDRIIVEAVAAVTGVDLNQLGVAVVELGGASMFRFAHRLFGPAGFDVPLTGLLDEDARVRWAATLSVAPADVEASGYAVCDPDLEGVYIDQLGTAVVIAMLVASPLIGEKSLLASCGAPDTANITRDQLWAYCRHRNHKTHAALAVAAGLDTAQAVALTPVATLLTLAGA